jgi:V-type H+-transporting ATPase subunit C
MSNLQKLKAIDNDIKKQMDDLNETKNHYASFAKKEGTSLTTKDLAEEIYGNVQKEFFVETFETEFLCTILAIVPKNKYDLFLNEYENIVPNAVVPRSLRFLNRDDRDGNQLYRFVAFNNLAESLFTESRKKGMNLRKFTYDEKKYRDDQQKKVQLEQRLDFQKNNLGSRSYYAFSELYMALIHLKVMRVFIDGVLRFGIPPRFYIGTIFPQKGKDKNIVEALIKTFADPSMLDMYGSKEDAGDTEDFYPFVMIPITSPSFLMQA